MRKILYVNGSGVLEIVKNGDNITYLVADGLVNDTDYGCNIKVDRNTFIQCFNKLKWIKTSWSEDIKKVYAEMEQFLASVK